MNHYPAMFAALRKRGEGVFAPFVMVDDSDPDTSEVVIEAPIVDGADVLELGASSIDLVADGLIIQEAHARALAASMDFQGCLEVVRRMCWRHSWLLIDMFIYGNAPFAMGLERFYSECAQAGIDSVLPPGVPTRKSAALSRAAGEASVDAVYIVPPSVVAETPDTMAAASRGYVYAVSRVGVTGTEWASSAVGLAKSMECLCADAVALVTLGFGISMPEQIAEAIAVSVDGAINGSATVKTVECYAPEITVAASNSNGAGGNEERCHYALGAPRSDLVTLTATMKKVTRPH